jgi:hypothetical protein
MLVSHFRPYNNPETGRSTIVTQDHLQGKEVIVMENPNGVLCLALGAMGLGVWFLFVVLMIVLRQLEHVTTQLAMLQAQGERAGCGCGALITIVLLFTGIVLLLGMLLR